MKVASREGPNCFVACRFVDSEQRAGVVKPLLSPKPGQPISEYLFCEVSSLGFRGGFLQTSTWLVSRRALLEVPFMKGLARNQETDWLIRAIPALGLHVVIVWKSLAIFHNESAAGRITSKSDWRYSLDWAIDRRQYFTDRSFPYFVAMVCTYAAKSTGQPISHLFFQIGVARKYGRITPKCFWLFLANWFVFPYGRFGVRRKLQNWISLAKRMPEGSSR